MRWNLEDIYRLSSGGGYVPANAYQDFQSNSIYTVLINKWIKIN